MENTNSWALSGAFLPATMHLHCNNVNPAYYGFSSMESNIIVSEAVEDFVTRKPKRLLKIEHKWRSVPIPDAQQHLCVPIQFFSATATGFPPSPAHGAPFRACPAYRNTLKEASHLHKKRP